MEGKQTFEDAENVLEELEEKQLENTVFEADNAENGKSGKAKKPKNKKRRRIILFAVLGVLLVLLIAAGIFLYKILNRPQDLFTGATANVTPEPRKELMEPAFDISAYLNTSPEPTEDAGTESPDTEPSELPDAAEAETPEASSYTEATDMPSVESVPDETPDIESSALPDAAETAAPEESPAAEPSILPDPGVKSTGTASPQAMGNIVNILLMGIDRLENGRTTSGSEPHTDVMMVVAVNFDKDTVDLITLPRDTFTTAPGYYGFYKLNGVFNVGGGMKDMAGGFDLTRRAAEIWLGGITIPYYYALDFQAVVDVVDAIGGIDFDVDQPFRANDPTGKHMIEGKYYDKGMHHLDGKAVLGYLRIRKRADGKDSSRTARQRRMMVAIYKKLKTEGQLSQVPALINAANNGIYTNTTLSQTTSLVNYAMNSIEPEQIRTRAMSGEDMIQHYYKYCFVDQQNRINIIKEVFGIDAEPVGICTPQYENWLYDIGFKTMKHLRQPEKVFKVIEERKAAGKKFTEKQLSAYAACYQAYTDLDKGLAECSDRVQQAYLDSSMTKSKTKAVEADVKKQLNALNKKVKDTTTALAKACGIDTKLWWDVGDRWFADSDINEKRVHFG